MAISQAICTSFKVELMKGVHNFTPSTGNTFNIALFTSSATLGASTTAYTAPVDPAADPTSTNEVSTTGTNYSGPQALTTTASFPQASGTTALLDFEDEVFSAVSLTARGALIYNDSAASDEAVMVLDFGGDKTATTGDFTIQFPTGDASNAIIRIA
jgi:hypothetical protein